MRIISPIDPVYRGQSKSPAVAPLKIVRPVRSPSREVATQGDAQLFHVERLVRSGQGTPPTIAAQQIGQTIPLWHSPESVAQRYNATDGWTSEERRIVSRHV